jgi:hypothetical protein
LRTAAFGEGVGRRFGEELAQSAACAKRVQILAAAQLEHIAVGVKKYFAWIRAPINQHAERQAIEQSRRE